MGLSQAEMKKAVESGYWTLYRFNPTLAAEGKNPFTLDSKEPVGDYQAYLKGEIRYASLSKQFPDVAQGLYEQNEADAKARYAAYKKMAE
jgi:pyruvate-ferredoxin/flavodoxin oxidoreductase